jgi:hypothetical protein
MDIHYPKPMDVLHSKAQHVCTYRGVGSLERPIPFIVGIDAEFNGKYFQKQY